MLEGVVGSPRVGRLGLTDGHHLLVALLGELHLHRDGLGLLDCRLVLHQADLDLLLGGAGGADSPADVEALLPLGQPGPPHAHRAAAGGVGGRADLGGQQLVLHTAVMTGMVSVARWRRVVARWRILSWMWAVLTGQSWQVVVNTALGSLVLSVSVVRKTCQILW